MLSNFFKSSLLFTFLLLIISKASNAEVGCAVVDEQWSLVYTKNTGGNTYTLPDVSYLLTTPIPSKLCDFHKGSSIINPIKGSCTYFINSTMYDGYLVSYISWCPIDDYIPYILIVISGLGFIYIRKRNLAF
jgi:hypothetical protein